MSNLLKSSSIYLVATILSSAIPFLLLPVLTRYLTQVEYGQLAMFHTTVAAFSAIVGLNVHGAANRKFFDPNLTEDILRQFIGSCFHILVISALFIVVLIMSLKDIISSFLGVPVSWVLLALTVSFASFISQMRLGQWQIRKQVKSYGIFQVSQSFFNVLISLLFVTVFFLGADGRVIAQVLVVLVFSLVSVYLLYKDKLIKFFLWNPSLVKEAIVFGGPLVPHAIGGFLLLTLDRFVVSKELGLASVGVYMVAVQLSSILKIAFQSINKAYLPWLYAKLSRNDLQDNRKIVKITYSYFGVLLIVGLMSFWLGPFVVVLVAGEEYRAAGSVVGFLCLGNVFNGAYLMVTNYVFYSKKTGRLSLVTIFSGSINVLLLFILIEPFGLIGVAVAYSISNLIMFILTWFLASRCHVMPWFTSRLTRGSL